MQEAAAGHRALAAQLAALQRAGQRQQPSDASEGSDCEGCGGSVQSTARLWERLRAAEEVVAERDACIEALLQATALLFRHAQVP